MTLREYARLVRECREVQREYFDPKARRPDTLERSKAAERRLDEITTQILGARVQESFSFKGDAL